VSTGRVWVGTTGGEVGGMTACVGGAAEGVGELHPTTPSAIRRMAIKSMVFFIFYFLLSILITLHDLTNEQK
jgi:hypothetical protein